jgi:D-alanine-D-alanine ligase
MPRQLKIALLANLKKNAPKFPGMSEDYWDDLDSETTIEALLAAMRQGGHEAIFYEGDANLPEKLNRNRPDLCFNICEAHFGDSREAQVPALLEMLRIPYTHSKVLTLALCLDKPMTKRVLNWHELPTPGFQTFERIDEPLDDDLKFPLFVKPAREGTSVGISEKSIVHNEPELREQLKEVFEKYKQTALVEQYIAGREVTVGLVGNIAGFSARRLPQRLYSTKRRTPGDLDDIRAGGLLFLPPMEVDLKPFEGSDQIYTNRLKTDLADQLNYRCPAPLTPQQIEELNWLTAAVFKVCGCSDTSRVDFRLDETDNYKPYILEINPLPGLAPVISDLVIEAAAINISHAELINRILDAALRRHGIQ